MDFHKNILRFKYPPAPYWAIIFLSLFGFNLEAQPSQEYQIKAAYLYNFSQFVTWPNDKIDEHEHFLLCVIGKDHFGINLDALTKMKVDDKNLIVKRYSNQIDLQQCQILFISDSEEKNLDSILQHLSDQSVLTVSDIENFIQKGGMLGFAAVGKKLSFEANLLKLQDADLKISSALLEIAIRVKK